MELSDKERAEIPVETHKHIKYRDGYKYQLAEDYVIQLEWQPEKDIKTEFITFTKTGVLTLKSGYASDGPSGPTRDTPSFMRGAFVHDGLYQLMRMELLPPEWKEYADDLLQELCLEDGMWSWRASYVHYGVDKAAGFAILPKNIKHVYTAPKLAII